MFHNHLKILFGKSEELMISLLLLNNHLFYEADLFGQIHWNLDCSHDTISILLGEAYVPLYIVYCSG